MLSPPSALLLVRGAAEHAVTWARRGLVPTWLVPGSEWTLLVPAGPALSSPPYDDPVAVLCGRPTPRRLRPSICLVADGPRALVVVHERGRRSEPRWLVWSREVGRTGSPGLDAASVRLVAGAAGSGRRSDPARQAAHEQALGDALAPDGRTAAAVVDAVLRALELPGAGLPLGAVQAADLPGAVRVEPDAETAARFVAFARHEAHLAAQLGEDR